MIKRLLIISALALSALTATAAAQGNGYIDILSPSKLELSEQDAPVYMFSEGDTFTGAPNDTFYAQYQWNLKQINMPKVWAKGYRGEGATICIIDSGLNEHDELDKNRIVGKYNIFNGSDNITDAVASVNGSGEKVVTGHGTLVTGIISASTNNNKGIAGVADKADIVVVKAFDADLETSTETLISALEYVAKNHPEVDVINMSEGTVEVMDNASKKKFQDAVNALVDKGVIIVASVGNEGSSLVSYPAGFDNVIGVGGTSSNKVKCVFSQFNESVFVSAPGGIESLENHDNPIATLDSAEKDSIVATSGTSFAAPQVAGIAAIAKSIYPKLTTNQFKEILKKTSEDLKTVPSYFDEEFAEQLGDLTGYDTLYGYGLIDADGIITEVEKLAENEYNADSYHALDYVKDEEGASVVVETDDMNASIYIASYEDNALSSVRRVDIGDLESETDDSGKYCRYKIPLLENEPEPSKLFLWNGMKGCMTWEQK